MNQTETSSSKCATLHSLGRSGEAIITTSIATINVKSTQGLTTTIGKLHETGTTSTVTVGREASGTAIDCLQNTNRGSAKATCSIETCAEGFILFLRIITGVYLPRHAAIATSSLAGMLA